MTAFYLILFSFGMCIGSFLNVVIDRIPKNESICGRSYCPHCKTTLKWFDLIPIFSFLILGGRCRYCKKPISFQYPLVELVTGVLFVFVGLQWFNGSMVSWLNSFYLFFIVSILIIIFLSDLKYYIISDKIIYPVIIIALIYNLISDLYFNHLTIKPLNHSLFFSGILAAFFIFIFFLLVYLVSRGRWIGFGDVKFAFFMGLVLGWPNILVALFLAVFLGAIIGIGLIITGKKKLKSEIAFGPFLATGTFAAMFWGENLIQWYLSFFINYRS